MKKRSAHQTPRRKKGLLKGVGDTIQHIRFYYHQVSLGRPTAHYKPRTSGLQLEWWNAGIVERWVKGSISF